MFISWLTTCSVVNNSHHELVNCAASAWRAYKTFFLSRNARSTVLLTYVWQISKLSSSSTSISMSISISMRSTHFEVTFQQWAGSYLPPNIQLIVVVSFGRRRDVRERSSYGNCLLDIGRSRADGLITKVSTPEWYICLSQCP